MSQRKYGSIKVDRNPSLLGVDKGFTGSEAYLSAKLGGAYLPRVDVGEIGRANVYRTGMREVCSQRAVVGLRHGDEE